MAKKLIPRNMRKSLKKTIKTQGGQTADPKHKGKNEARKQIRGKVQSGEIKRKSVDKNWKRWARFRIETLKQNLA